MQVLMLFINLLVITNLVILLALNIDSVVSEVQHKKALKELDEKFTKLLVDTKEVLLGTEQVLDNTIQQLETNSKEE